MPRPTETNAAAHDTPAVRCTHLIKRFGMVEAVQNATLDVPRGSLMALLGPSGGGKTTILRMIAGFESPDGGSVEIDGVLVAGNGKSVPPEKRRVGMVFQDYALFPHMTVRANVAFGINGKDRDTRVDEVLDLVGLMVQADRMPHELSGGQQQRVALARALAPNPAVILLDEPFSNLDATLRDRVRRDVKRILRQAGASAIFVTHDQDEAFSLADEVGIMLDNSVVQCGKPEDVYLHPASLAVARFLGDANLLDGEVKDGRVDCELGTLVLNPGSPPAGPATVAVRPETIIVNPIEGAMASALVVDTQFRGFYKVASLQLPSGRIIRSVMSPHIRCDTGSTVEVGVNSAVSAFPLGA